ncbi:MAG: recombination and strand exchange inhibitor protein, partial [Microvirga sp.]|nr:recombination and strand exchange inhibitor protein [Microvirga sp.]
MQMDSKTLGVLEWPKVIERLVAEAATMVGKDRCQAIDFHTDLEGVSHALRLTTEADELIRITGGFPLGGIRDIRQALRRVEQSADLDGPDLLAIADTMDAARRIKTFMAEHAEAVPAFAELAVRQRIRQTQSGIRERLQRMLNSHAQHLQESLITVRGDRFVLPVRSDAKSQVPGLVHDQSASGSTLYIEPMAVVELNNSLSKARLDERDEIARILERLTQLVLADLEEIHWTLEALAEIDFTVAKARLSRKLDARAPRLSRDGFTRLYSARHPLLAAQESEGGHKVVAIDIEVGGQIPILLITGPNTGGKTVTLKTLGLVTLMTQAGLHAPVAEGSVVGLVRSIYADIGDEQSLAQSLSTFSGHMTNIIRILERADRKSLVLLDEIGAGTDPQEGAVLARAIIEAFLRRGTRLVATTHYGELKLMAYETPGVRNASVEF